MVPSLSPEQKKTAARMMGILSKKLAERGYTYPIGEMGALLTAGPNACRIILNTKDVREARDIIINGRGKKCFLAEGELQVLEALLKKDSEGNRVGEKELFEAIDTETNPEEDTTRNDWIVLCRQAAKTTEFPLSPKDEENLGFLALHQKLQDIIADFHWKSKAVVKAFLDAKGQNGEETRQNLSRELGEFVSLAWQRLGPETRKLLKKTPEGRFAALAKSLWTDAELNIFRIAHACKPMGTTGEHLDEAIRRLDELVPKFEQQKEKYQFEREANRLHQDLYKGDANDPVPVSPIAWVTLVLELCQTSPSTTPTPAQIRWLPRKEDLGDQTFILAQNEPVGSKKGRMVVMRGVWTREHLLSTIDADSDLPILIEPTAIGLSTIFANDNLPREEQVKARKAAVEKMAGGDPIRKLEILTEAIEKHSLKEPIPWNSMRILRGTPRDETEEILRYFFGVIQDEELHERVVKVNAGPNASEREIARASNALLGRINRLWDEKWAEFLQREYHTPKNFVEDPEDWWASWEDDIQWMSTALITPPNLFKAIKTQEGEKNTRSVGTTGVIVEALTTFNNPFYWIKKDFFRAAAETDLPSELKFSDFTWPIPTGTLFLERGCLEVRGLPVGSITFATTDPKREKKNGILFLPVPNTGIERLLVISANLIDEDREETLIVTTHCRMETTIEEAKKPSNAPLIESELALELLKDIQASDHRLKNLATPSLESQDFKQSLPAILAKIMLAVASRPELLEREVIPEEVEEPQKPKSSKPAKEKKETWAPNIIGANYRIRVETETDKEKGEARDGRSPRSHFRRGHFRNQACGRGLLERRIVWIEPVIVGIRGQLPMPKK